MPYILNKTDGRRLVAVEDGQIDQTTTDLTFVGKNYSGYGQILNQNLVKLLENFANGVAPTKPMTGQLWYDTANKSIKVYNGLRFRSASFLDVESATPRDASKGDFWFHESEQRLYVNNGFKWVLIGPSIPEETGVLITPTIISDIDGIDHQIIKFSFNEDTVAVISFDDSFIPGTEDSSVSNNFSVVKRGITLASSNFTTGVSSTENTYFWGTSADSLRLAGFPASDYVRKSEPTTTTNQLTVATDLGITIGNNRIIQVHADTANLEGKISAINGDKISFGTFYDSTFKNIITIFRNNIFPNTSLPVSLGGVGPGQQYANVYSSKFSAGSSSASADLEGNFTVNGSLRVINLTAGSPTTNATATGRWIFNGQIISSGSTNSLIIEDRDNAVLDYRWYVLNNILRLQKTSSDVLSVNSSGFVGINTTSQTNRLEVNGNTRIVGNVRINNEVDPEFIIGNNSVGKRIVSTSLPSGGSNGDIWYRVNA
jgi:hypothetical protein